MEAFLDFLSSGVVQVEPLLAHRFLRGRRRPIRTRPWKPERLHGDHRFIRRSHAPDDRQRTVRACLGHLSYFLWYRFASCFRWRL